MNTTKSRNRNQGFTLLETAVAIILTATALLALASMAVFALNVNEVVEFETKAIELANAKMDTLRSAFSRSIVDGISPTDLAAGSHGPETMTLTDLDVGTQNNLSFEVQWDVVELTGGSKELTVSVTGLGRALLGRTITISSVLAP